jgi:competence protein ComEA
MGSTTPPWRSLDAPTVTGDTGGSPPATAAATPAASADGSIVLPATGRVLASIGVAGACAVIAFVLATSGGAAADVVVDGGATLPGQSAGSSPDPSSGSLGGVLVVEIVGAVVDPGVYRLPAGSRVGDLVAAAGGYGARVDTTRADRDLNQAAMLHDGDQVRVPSRDDPEVAAGGSDAPASAGTGDGLVDLNRATAAELDALPGIGPVTIEKIVAAREEAPFTAVEDLRTRGLLGEKTFERIRESLVVR